MSLSTSLDAYVYTKMDFIITCTSVSSLHMEALRTVTDTFTVNFKSSTTVDCETDFNSYLQP